MPITQTLDKEIFSKVLRSKLYQAAKKLYIDLPYHNFQHTLDTVNAAHKIIQACIKEGLNPDSRIIYIALLFHDAGYHINHREKGFQSKEGFSAYLADKELKKAGESEICRKEVKKVIMGTRPKNTFDEIGQSIARAADLTGLAGTYKEFKQNSINVSLEDKRAYRRIHGKELKDKDRMKIMKKRIDFYLSQDIKLTKKYQDKHGNSTFHIKTRKNLMKYLAELEKSIKD